MEKIEAIIMPFKLDELKRTLSDAGFVSLTISEVYDSDRQNGQSKVSQDRKFPVDFLPKLKVEVVVPDDRADVVVSLICSVSKTGSICGDGSVFVSSLKNVIRIRPGEPVERAIGEDPEPEMDDVENTMATAVRSLADYLIAERPGRVCREIIAIMERPLFVHVLALTDGNQRRAAHLLGLNRNTFHSRCRRYGLLSSAQARIRHGRHDPSGSRGPDHG